MILKRKKRSIENTLLKPFNIEVWIERDGWASISIRFATGESLDLTANLIDVSWSEIYYI